MVKKSTDRINHLTGTPTGQAGREPLLVVKIGGNIIDDEKKLADFLKQFAELTLPDHDGKARKILVHGGGKLATDLADQLGIQQQLIDGRRITDAATLRIATMVYAGYINKTIVAQLQAANCNAIGLCGADGNIIKARKRNHPTIDYGYVGDINEINAACLVELLNAGFSPILAPLTHDGKGQLLNTNADTIAQEIAKSLTASFAVTLIYAFEKNGVLLDANDDTTVIPSIKPGYYEQLKMEKKIFAGMIPKIDNAFAAVNNGVEQVIIGKAEQLMQLINHSAGTKITNE